MHTFTTTALGKSVATGLAEAAYGPLRLVSHKRTVGVLLSPRDALHFGVICKHGEEPEECAVCGPAGRIGRHLWKLQSTGLECPACGSRLSGWLHGRWRCAGCGYYFEPTAAAGKTEAE